MTVSVVGRRYALALFNLAEQEGSISEIGKHLGEFTETFEANDELRVVFENPSFGQDVRRKIIIEIAARSGMHDAVRNALQLLSDRGRLGHIGEVREAFDALAQEKSGEVRAEVTTADALPEAYFIQLQKRLSEVTGKKVVLVKKTDPDLIGGVVARIGDQVFDGSVKNRLSGLRDELLR